MAKKFLLFILLFLIIASIYFFAWTYYAIYSPIDVSSNEEIVFSIEKGDGVVDIADNLTNNGIIRSKNAFLVYSFVAGRAKNFQSGTYLLSLSMNASMIADKFNRGETIKERITIIEGWNLRDIAGYLEGRGMFQAEELFELVGFPLIDYSVTTDLPIPRDFSQDFDALKDKPQNLSLEGYLFPDTYELNLNESLESVVEKMLHNFNEKLTLELRTEIARQEKSIFEIITMASLIEKEVQVIEHKKVVSGILWKRLEIGMPLQIDSTVNYVTGRRDVGVLITETEADSPYNTYRYRGLPLGPIANPGISSIEAAIYPEESPYFYYLSTPKGETIFSVNLEEHNVAKAKYLK